jgi:Ca2+-binding EF-hand superfamily protein
MATRREAQRGKGRALTSDELADAEEQFDECDTDGDRRIDFAEYSQLVENLGLELPPTQRRNRFDAIDSDADGAIDRSEFIDWWRASAP